MAFRLTHGGLDEDDEVSDHESLTSAIEAAVAWFRGGYEDNPTIPNPPDLTEDFDRLLRDLAAGREFYCGRFYERISVEEVATLGQP